jgi:hypothetical protein
MGLTAVGASLAKVVLGPTWADRLPAPSRVLFAHMAITAKDHDDPPLYFGGRNALVLAVYGALAADPTELHAQYRYVRKLLQPIKAQGGIHVQDQSYGDRTRYEIRVMGRPGEEPIVPPGEEQIVPPGGGTNSSSWGGTNSSPGGGTNSSVHEVQMVPPKEYEEERAGLTPGHMTPDPAPTHVDARDSFGDRNWDHPTETAESPCQICGRSQTRCRSTAAKTSDPHLFTPAWKAS